MNDRGTPKIFRMLNTNDRSPSIFVVNRSGNSRATEISDSGSVVRLKFIWKRNVVSNGRTGYLFCVLFRVYARTP